MKKILKKAGFTMAETLLVVAIMATLAGLSTVSVQTYRESQRNLTKLQYDTYAREIFVAAQNHLSMVASQGFLGHTDVDERGTPDTTNRAEGESGVYYYVGLPTYDENPNDPNPILKRIMPKYAVDENARAYGGYIIRYHYDSAQVLDVFFWAKNELMKYPLAYDPEDYSDFMEHRSEYYKDYMKHYKRADDHAVIGYYGGAEAAGLTNVSNLTHGVKLLDPSIEVINGAQLTVKVTNPNPQGAGTVKLVITGLTSGGERTYILPEDVCDNSSKTIVLDDITTGEGEHFFENCHLQNSSFTGNDQLIPGENITIQAVAYNDEKLTNVAYSAPETTNSLFGDGSDPEHGVVNISNIRHLENLSPAISKVNKTNGVMVSGVPKDVTVKITEAKQITDLDWKDFLDFFGGTAVIVDIEGTSTAGFMPVTPALQHANNDNLTLDYDGGGHSISNIKINSVDENNAAGLFGTLSGGSVTNLRLIDFTVTPEYNHAAIGKYVGALAGKASNTNGTMTFDNIIVRNTRPFDSDDNRDSNGEPKPTIKGAGGTGEGLGSTGGIGGLIGTATNCKIEWCGASLAVESTTGNAGGLVGTADGTTSISGSYSGGHTISKTNDPDPVTISPQYSPAVYPDTGKYNVTGKGDVGGLVGSFDGGTIKNSYSTCSVSTSNSSGNVGGLAGSLTANGEVKNCYATGLVDHTTGTAGAFAGTLTGSVTNGKYYMMVNEYKDASNEFQYLSALGGDASNTSITAFDASAESYNNFVGTDRASATPYDAELNRYYHGKYNFLTPIQLAESNEDKFVKVHYGDWPVEETWVINTKE